MNPWSIDEPVLLPAYIIVWRTKSENPSAIEEKFEATTTLEKKTFAWNTTSNFGSME